MLNRYPNVSPISNRRNQQGEVYRAEKTSLSEDKLGDYYGEIEHHSPDTMVQVINEANLFQVGTEIYFKEGSKESFFILFREDVYSLEEVDL
ncbi:MULTISPECIES: hypothetical protein [Pontibacillus]|uniref:Uncharacterized protein n=1 Tax=Pontibacillus chungwhensis TaxID=265426 RepID=A0ABY8V1M6_9BACI|nr:MULTISPECIES: hypothetical protein [Pontibacillus]MCD5324358.1 hypothetical protein [Pontibacillus sp. HN14]WIF99343.1 hypothetical protein QNI29_06715 [Pontibacillus chungwhensis]